MNRSKQERKPKEAVIPMANGRGADWLDSLLMKAQTRDGFQQRCEDAALGGMALARMRRERREIDSLPLALGAYVEGLALKSGMELSALRRHYRVEAKFSESAGNGWLRIARDLGISANEAVTRLQIGLAESFGLLPAMDGVRARGSKKKQSVEGMQQWFAECHGSLPLEFRQAAAKVEAMAKEVYQE